MFREIIRVTNERLQIRLPKNLLNKTIEVLVFPVSDETPVICPKSGPKSSAKELGFNAIRIPTKGWKFDRSEIYDD